MFLVVLLNGYQGIYMFLGTFWLTGLEKKTILGYKTCDKALFRNYQTSSASLAPVSPSPASTK